MTTPALTPSLEDYLETIYLLQQGNSREARVRDIAAARSVKASSVSPALKRLADLGFLSYEQRESILLTEDGKIAARRVYARHVLLFQFFHDILGMEEDKAREEACGLEHALSDEGMDRFVRFFESRTMCPHCQNCLTTETPCDKCDVLPKGAIPSMALAELQDEEYATVLGIRTTGSKRQEILDMGILPNVRIRRIRTTHHGILISIDKHELEVKDELVRSVIVKKD